VSISGKDGEHLVILGVEVFSQQHGLKEEADLPLRVIRT
jgi:hypothetical protein